MKIPRPRGRSGRRALLVAAVLLLGLFGFQRLSGGPSDERKIERALDAAATANPRVCDDLLTTPYREQRWGVDEPYADEVCEREVEERPASSVEIGRIDVEGDHATVLMRSVGESRDGSWRRVELVKEGGDWKLNRLDSIVHFDRGRWDRVYRANLIAFGTPVEAADCAMDQVRRLSDAEVKRLTISDPRAVFTSLLVRCDRTGIERNLISSVGGPDHPLPSAAVTCAEREIRAASDGELVRLQTDPGAFVHMVYACDPPAYFASLERGLVESGYLAPTEADCVVSRLQALPPRTALRIVYDDGRYQALIERCEG